MRLFSEMYLFRMNMIRMTYEMIERSITSNAIFNRLTAIDPEVSSRFCLFS